MIIIKVADYCNNGCERFEPVVTRRPLIGFNDRDTYVRCVHRDMCEYIRDYLDRKEEPK